MRDFCPRFLHGNEKKSAFGAQVSNFNDIYPYNGHPPMNWCGTKFM